MLLLDGLLLCAVCSLVPLAIVLPWPYPDRLVVVPQNASGSTPPSPRPDSGDFATDKPHAAVKSLNAVRVQHFDRRIRELLDPPWRVLDAGCGGGLVANELGALPNYTVECLDPSWEALRIAEDAAMAARLNTVRFRTATVYFIPFEDDTFDVAILSNVAEHLLDLPSALMELARVLRPNGLLLFSSIDRSLQSFFWAAGGPSYVPRLLSSSRHDWRLFVQPEELELGLNVSGEFANYTFEAFDPSPRTLLDLSLCSLGILAPDGIANSWSIAPPSFTTVSYIGHAVRLPPLIPAENFEDGEILELLAQGGDHSGEWLRGAVLSHGDRTNTYNVLLAGGAEFNNIPAYVLRKVANGTQRLQFYDPEDDAEVLSAEESNTWLMSIVVRNASRAYTYDINAGGRMVYNVSVMNLRRPAIELPVFEVGEYVEVEALTGPIAGRLVRSRVLAFGDVRHWYSVSLKNGKGGENVMLIFASRLLKLEPIAFEPGEDAEVMHPRTPHLGPWVRCRVKGPGTAPGTYDVKVIRPHLGDVDLKDVPAQAIRRPPPPDSNVEPSPKVVPVFEVGDTVEVQATAGAAKGKWIRASVVGISKKANSYNIKVPGRRGSFQELRDIHASVLHKAASEEL